MASPPPPGRPGDENAPLLSSEGESHQWPDQDGTLPYHNPSARSHSAATARRPSVLSGLKRSPVLALLVLGVFLGACPIPRKHMNGLLRQFLITVVVSVIMTPAPRSEVFSQPKRVERLLVANAGFYLSLYGMFGAANEVHVEMGHESLLMYRTPLGWNLGYLSRMLLAAGGFCIQKSAGVHSTKRILGGYLLCMLLLYFDVPSTLIHLAVGGDRW
ncbi:hypothetical protein GQ53DRAFT_740645, partial [Thozetella sp. PMI_491]